MLFHPIFSFLANFIIDGYGIKNGLHFGLVFTIIGAGSRIFINNSFWFVILGQSLAAIGNPFITNGPSKIASNWFFSKDVLKTIKSNKLKKFKESSHYYSFNAIY